MEQDKKTEKKQAVTRREFIRKAAVTASAAAGVAAVAAKAGAQAPAGQYEYKNILPPEVLGANDKIYTGHIGIGGMGRSNLGFVLKRDDMRPVALCDIWWKNLMRAEQMAGQKFTDKSFTTHHDFRELLENKDVDAVVIATPDHWHCLTTLHAADAGKAIYCEKPCATTIAEGRAMVKKIEDTGVVFQAGNFQRSMPHFIEAVELVKSGYLGQVAHVETYIHDGEGTHGIGMGDDDISKFEGIDWDFHQGWVEHKPFNTNRWIYNFRWFLDYSGGKITDWGAHLVDIALWAMGEFDNPVKNVVATGGKYVVQDNRTTPDTLDVAWEFENYTLTFSNRVYNNYLPKDYQSHGILFHGAKGTMLLHRGGYTIYPVFNDFSEPEPCEEKSATADRLNEYHWENFVACIRDGAKPNSSVHVIHNTTSVCHMGTCSYVTGAKLGWDPKEQKLTGGDSDAVKQANEFAYRPYQNGWSLEAPYHKG